MTEKKRPNGVTVLGVGFLLSSIPGLLAALIGGISGAHNIKSTWDVVLDIVMRILFIASPLICILTGVGLLMLKNWARLVALFLSPILCYIIIGVMGIVLDGVMPPIIISSLIDVGIIGTCFCIVYYLTRPKVKGQFKCT